LAAVGGTIATNGCRPRSVAAAPTVLGAAALDVYAARCVRACGAPELSQSDAPILFDKSLAIGRPPQACYERWRDVESLPKFMWHIESITAIDPRRSHWVAKAPGGTHVEWDSEIIDDQPGRLIAWRSVEGSDVEHQGTVRFDAEPNGNGSIVSVNMRYRPPAGRLGAIVATLTGDDAEQSVTEDLRRFKRLLECGEIPTTVGQPAPQADVIDQLLRKAHER
ncbi:MAG TPA: SRPBCC family protein, partial [Casimicrobiaceae bacterium]|nr:SRPBCC family protein [Casimicrobiaceae bacterium]